jgi:galactokinase
MVSQDKIASLFQEKFKQSPRWFVAPGRINLIGEHTDYNEGFVMPAAIDKHFLFAVAPNHTSQFYLTALDLNESNSFSLDSLQPGSRWINYLMGVVDSFLKRGKKIGGLSCIFTSTIPAGAGLSSSAALCSGFGYALNEIFGCGLSRLDLALIAQEAEHRFAGTKCGIMDMYASLLSQEGSVMLLDCRSNQHQYLPVHFDDYEFLLIDTKVKHSLNTSGYNDRREACEEGVRILKKENPAINSLRDVSEAALVSGRSQLNENVFRKCLYVVQEISRTLKAAEHLRSNELKKFGELMYQTHWGLSNDYEVSCEESDWLVRWAAENKVAGARQMGGGFGGCTINLIKKELVSPLKDDVRKKYFATFKKEPEFYSVHLTQGVNELKP